MNLNKIIEKLVNFLAMEGIPHFIRKPVKEIFNDFKGKQVALIKALTVGNGLIFYFLCQIN